MKTLQFHETIPTIEVDGTLVVMLSDSQLANRKNLAGEVAAQITEFEGKLETWDAARKKLKKTDKDVVSSNEFDTVQVKLMSHRARLAELREKIAESERLREKYAALIKLQEFWLHTYSFQENKAAQDEATMRDISGQGMTNIADYRINVLYQCMDRWSSQEDITRDAIGAMHPKIVDALYTQLAMRSEADEASLSFLASPSMT